MSALDDIKKNINKKFKDNILGFGNAYVNIDRIPFSSPRLNYLTRGGIPWPAVTEISGPEGSGKTTLLGDLAKNAQAKGMICGLVDTENKTDLEYWKWLGVDIDNILVCRPYNASGEDILQMCLDLMKEGVQFLGLDSIASLVPKQVLSGEMDDKTYAGSSGIMSTFSQKLTGTGIIQRNNIAFVGINQVRDNLGGFGLKTGGGHFWRHACTCRLQVTRSNPFDEHYKELALSTTEDISGYTMDVKLIKNQFGRDDRRFAQCTFNNKRGIDVVIDAIEVGLLVGVIVRNGAWYKICDPETGEILLFDGEEFRANGKMALITDLNNKTQIRDWLLETINSMIKNEYLEINQFKDEDSSTEELDEPEQDS